MAQAWPADDSENRARVWESRVSESSMGEEDSASLATSLAAAGETETNEEQAGSSMNGTEPAGSMWAVATDFGVTFPGQRRFPHLPMHE